MAEGGSNVICRFFATTSCRDGDKCLFSHDRSNTVLDSVCRYYLQGRCLYGNSCHYDHVRVKPNPTFKNKKNDGGKQSAASNRNAAVTGKQRVVPLKSGLGQAQNGILKRSGKGPGSENWVLAPEFIPKSNKSYADVLKAGEHAKNEANRKGVDPEEELLCQYYLMGECPYNELCSFIHGEICELCGKACLLPFDKEQQRRHLEICEKELEKDMELSFAIQRSIDKTCGICFDVIMEKQPLSARRFGILEKCNHIFCLSCIRTWRKMKHGDNSEAAESSRDPVVTRTCPECRIPSDFVTPSQYWVDNEEEKQKLIKEYKEAMSKKPCQYFKQGNGSCPFAGACFYLHAYPDGTKAVLPPPRRRRRRNQNGELDFSERIFLWDFFELRDDIMMQVDWDSLLSSDSDESEESVSFYLD